MLPNRFGQDSAAGIGDAHGLTALTAYEMSATVIFKAIHGKIIIAHQPIFIVPALYKHQRQIQCIARQVTITVTHRYTALGPTVGIIQCQCHSRKTISTTTIEINPIFIDIEFSFNYR